MYVDAWPGKDPLALLEFTEGMGNPTANLGAEPVCIADARPSRSPTLASTRPASRKCVDEHCADMYSGIAVAST